MSTVVDNRNNLALEMLVACDQATSTEPQRR